MTSTPLPTPPPAPTAPPNRATPNRGDPNLAPRCGAKTRTGAFCRAPAMPNGRCRLHGGLSTGPRTPMGKERMLAANTTHGRTTAPMRAEHHHARTLARRTRVVCAAKLLEAYLPPEMAARLAAGPEELWAPTHPSNLPFVQICEPTLYTQPAPPTRRPPPKPPPRLPPPRLPPPTSSHPPWPPSAPPPASRPPP